MASAVKVALMTMEGTDIGFTTIIGGEWGALRGRDPLLS